jgi:hypothetical protein
MSNKKPIRLWRRVDRIPVTPNMRAEILVHKVKKAIHAGKAALCFDEAWRKANDAEPAFERRHQSRRNVPTRRRSKRMPDNPEPDTIESALSEAAARFGQELVFYYARALPGQTDTDTQT